jgi:hypothetical protein
MFISAHLPKLFMDFTWISTFALELTKRNIGSHLARWTEQALEELVPGNHGDAMGPSRDRQGAQAAPCDGEFFHGVPTFFNHC